MRSLLFFILGTIWMVFAWMFLFDDPSTFEKLVITGLWLALWTRNEDK